MCIGGIGINGQITFNEPPDPALAMDVETFAQLPTRVIDLD